MGVGHGMKDSPSGWSIQGLVASTSSFSKSWTRIPLLRMTSLVKPRKSMLLSVLKSLYIFFFWNKKWINKSKVLSLGMFFSFFVHNFTTQRECSTYSHCKISFVLIYLLYSPPGYITWRFPIWCWYWYLSWVLMKWHLSPVAMCTKSLFSTNMSAN